jgi:hypothetical protein
MDFALFHVFFPFIAARHKPAMKLSDGRSLKAGRCSAGKNIFDEMQLLFDEGV